MGGRGVHEGSVALGRGAVHVGAMLEQRHDDIEMAFFLHRRMQRCDACGTRPPPTASVLRNT